MMDKLHHYQVLGYHLTHSNTHSTQPYSKDTHDNNAFFVYSFFHLCPEDTTKTPQSQEYFSFPGSNRAAAEVINLPQFPLNVKRNLYHLRNRREVINKNTHP